MSIESIRWVMLCGLVAVLLSVACEDTTEVSGPDSVLLKEWAIELGAPERAPGSVDFQVQNIGTMDHEVVVIRSDLAPEKLPVSGGTVDLNQLDVVGEKENIERREKTSLSVTLTPGSYIFICNVSGHYALGMRSGLLVK